MALDEWSELGISKTKVGWTKSWWWLALIYFLLYGFFFLPLGFGLDTDAWLMAQTVEKLRMGEGYDPARSLGNPLYEFLLVPLQWGEQWIISNAINLLIFCIIIWRIPAYFPKIELVKVAGIRFLFLLFPLFLKNATSSIEFIPALWFLMEATAAIEKDKLTAACLWTVLAIFCRLEFALFLLLFQMPFWQKRLPAFLLILISWGGYIFYAWGKNPVPWRDASYFYFFIHRFGALFVHGGAVFLVYPLMVIALLHLPASEIRYRNLAFGNLLAFMFSPFEWEYLLPFFFISLVGLTLWCNQKQLLGLGVLIQLLNFIHFQWDRGTNQFLIEFQLPHQERAEAFGQYQWAQRHRPAQKTLYLSGATLFPYPVKDWEKVKDNRIFHRKDSHFYVGERLGNRELDSLHHAGWVIEKNTTMP